jgi:hypothetical protein
MSDKMIILVDIDGGEPTVFVANAPAGVKILFIQRDNLQVGENPIDIDAPWYKPAGQLALEAKIVLRKWIKDAGIEGDDVPWSEKDIDKWAGIKGDA